MTTVKYFGGEKWDHIWIDGRQIISEEKQYILIFNIIIDKQFRRKGLGSRYIRYLMDQGFIILIHCNTNPSFWNKFGRIECISPQFKKQLSTKKWKCPNFVEILYPV